MASTANYNTPALDRPSPGFQRQRSGHSFEIGVGDALAGLEAGQTKLLPNGIADTLTYRPDIDGLRAVAVLGVVVYHAFPRLMPGGFAGVDIFFVISGFLISRIIFKDLDTGSFSIADFYAHRIRRIFPALALVLAASWGLAWFCLIPKDFMRFAHSVLGGAGFYANFAHPEAGYFQSPDDQRPLLHLWSLGVEEQFYLIWPILLILCWQWNRKALPIALGSLLMASLLDSIIRTPIAPLTAFYLPDTRLWELAIGGGVAYLSFHKRANFLSGTWFPPAVGLAAILGPLLFFNARLEWPGWCALFPTMGTALIIASGPGARLNEFVLASKTAVRVGKISYPWYLWHWPLLVFGRSTPWGVAQVFIDGFAVLISAVLAAATYRFVERPVRFGAASTKIRTLGPLLAMLVPTALAVAVLAGKGFPGRFPQEILEIFRPIPWPPEPTGCFDTNFASGQGVKQRGPGVCTEAKSSASDARPLVVLWGDSHAFALHAGLKDYQRRTGSIRLAIFTKGSCPFFARPGTADFALDCLNFNIGVRDEIRRLKPDLVLLDAFWGSKAYFPDGVIDGSAVHDSLLTLSADGAKRVVLLGTVPLLSARPANVILREWIRTDGKLPDHSLFGLARNLREIDGALQNASAKTGTVFVSLLNKLCSEDGCMLLASRDPLEPLLVDGNHLTATGSKVVIERIAAEIFREIN